jgi:hypothetical protein
LAQNKGNPNRDEKGRYAHGNSSASSIPKLGSMQGVGSEGFKPPAGVEQDEYYPVTTSTAFQGDIIKKIKFPVTPLGWCMEGAKEIGERLSEDGYKVKYSYNPDMAQGRGHIWVIVQNPKDKNWLAVDNYYGPISDDLDYYKAPFTFDDFELINELMPHMKIL